MTLSQISWISDIYITVHNSTKLQLWSSIENDIMVGGQHHMRNCIKGLQGEEGWEPLLRTLILLYPCLSFRSWFRWPSFAARHSLFLTALVSPETHTGSLFTAVRLSVHWWGQKGVENTKPKMPWEDLEPILRGPGSHEVLLNRGSDRAQSPSALFYLLAQSDFPEHNCPRYKCFPWIQQQSWYSLTKKLCVGL